jgi:hypothetical protein
MKAEQLLEMSVIQLKKLTLCLLTKMPKISIYKTILPALSMSVKCGFLF